MKRNIKNDKVLKAMTIGLAAMIAATSMPMNVYADGDGEGDGDTDTKTENTETQSSEGSSSEDSSSEQVQEVNNAVDTASTRAEALVPSTPATAEGSATTPAPEGSIPAAADAVDNLLVAPAKGQTAEQTAQLPGVSDALKQLNVASGSVGEVKVDLLAINAVVATGGELGASPIETVYSEYPVSSADAIPVEEANIMPSDVTDDKEATVIRVLPTFKGETVESKTQEGIDEEKKYYSDETPVGGGDNGPASVDYYDKEENGTEFYNSTVDKKPFVKSIVEDYTAAVDYFEDYVADNTDQQSLADAFDAAAEADRKLKIEENKIKALDEAIKDSRAAEEALKKAKKDLETVKAIKSKYDAVMTEYFSKMISDFKHQGVYTDGSIDFDKCVTVLKTQKSTNIDANENGIDDGFENAINDKADNKDGTNGTLNRLSRSLLCELVKAQLEGQGGTDVKFEYESWGKYVSIDEVKDPNKLKKQDGPTGIGGRKSRFAVKYTVDGVEQGPIYFNYIYKANRVDTENGKEAPRGDKLDLENGIIYLAQITGTDKKNLVINDVQTLNDDYSLFANVNNGAIGKAVEAVELAKQKSTILKDAVNAIRNSILGKTPKGREEFDSDEAYDNYFTEFNEACDSEFNDLKVAAKYSRVKLNALIELIGPRPVIDNGEDNDDDSSDSSSSSDATGGVVFDAGTGTLSLPGLGIPSITVPTSPTSGVAGVRTNGSGRGVAGVKVASNASNTLKDADKKIDQLKETKDKKYNPNQKYKKIENNLIPLAETPFDESVHMNWGWLLLIFLLGATGLKLYENYKSKYAAEAAAAEENKEEE